MSRALTLLAVAACLAGAGPRGHAQAPADAVTGLIRQLDQPEQRPSAFRALAEFGPAASPALPALTEILRTSAPSSDDFLAAARALGRIGPAARSALPFLRTALMTAKLSEATGRGREAAAEAVRAILAPGDPDLAAYANRLAGALGHADPFVRVEAARGLRELGPSAAQAVPELRRALRREPAPKIRALAAEALGAIGPKARPALEDLRKASAGEDAAVRRAAAAALAALAAVRD